MLREDMVEDLELKTVFRQGRVERQQQQSMQGLTTNLIYTAMY